MDSLLDKLVPKNHLVRKLNNILDFSFIADVLESYATNENSDIIFIAKYLLLIHLYHLDREMKINMPLPERIDQEINDNMAYRLFLEIDLDEHALKYNEIMQATVTHGSQEKWTAILTSLLQQCKENGLPYEQGSAGDY